MNENSPIPKAPKQKYFRIMLWVGLADSQSRVAAKYSLDILSIFRMLKFVEICKSWGEDTASQEVNVENISNIKSVCVSFPINLSQNQGLFKWVSFSHQVAKVLEFQLQHQSFQRGERQNNDDFSMLLVSSKHLEKGMVSLLEYRAPNMMTKSLAV